METGNSSGGDVSPPVDAILPSAGGTRECLERILKTHDQHFPLQSTTNG